jgi:hypothetical protein
LERSNYEIEPLDAERLAVETGYRLTWDEENTEDLFRYLKSKGFEEVETGEVNQLAYEDTDGIQAEAWIDSGQDHAMVKVYQEILDSEGQPPLTVDAIVNMEDGISIEDWLSEEQPDLEPEQLEQDYDTRQGVPFGAQPKDYEF